MSCEKYSLYKVPYALLYHTQPVPLYVRFARYIILCCCFDMLMHVKSLNNHMSLSTEVVTYALSKNHHACENHKF